MPIYRIKGFGSDAYRSLDGMIDALVYVDETSIVRRDRAYGGLATLISFGPPKDEHTFYKDDCLEEGDDLYFVEVFLEPVDQA